MQVSRWAKRLADPGKYRKRMLTAAYRGAELATAENHRAEGTGENEWYTPIKYVEAARAVMGGIDLDPATSATAQAWIKAEKFFTKRDTGRPKNGGGIDPISRKSAASDAGLSERQRKTALRVSNVPEESFESQVESGTPPTVTVNGPRKLRRAIAFRRSPMPDGSAVSLKLLAGEKLFRGPTIKKSRRMGQP